MPGPLYLQAAARNAEEEKAEMDGDMIFVNSLIMEPFTGGHWAVSRQCGAAGPGGGGVTTRDRVSYLSSYQIVRMKP